MSPEPRLFLEPDAIAAHVSRLGAEITRSHPREVVLVGFLKDSTIFLADLLRQIGSDCVVDFLALSAYQPGQRRVRLMKDLDTDVSGREVVLVRDIVDTGLSVRYVLNLIADRGARSVELCALLDRSERHILPLEVDYCGQATDERFLVGYGLDLSEQYRNLPAIYSVDPIALDADPEGARLALYGPGAASAESPARG